MTDLEQQLTDHLQRKAAAVTPRYNLEAVEHRNPSVESVHRDDRPNRRPLIRVLVGAAAALVGVAVVGTLIRDDRSTTVTTPAVDTSPTAVTTPAVETSPPETVTEVAPTNVFLGRWTSTDTDGSVQTMQIATAGDGSAQMTVHDAAASAACSGSAATVTGTGELNSVGDLVSTISGLTCDDGSEPAVSGEDLGAYTLAYDSESDTLTDNVGVVWLREGADDPSPAPPTSDTMWPQSSIDEVTAAQELAGAGDPAYTWQVDPQLTSEEWWGYLREPGAEIVERFLRQELGWDQFLFNPYQGDDGDGAADGVIRGIVYLRCKPGETNPLYPITPDGHQEAPGAELCAPTIDDLHYETVSLDLAQLDQRGPAGIWVVNGWTMTAPFTQTDPRVAETEATARLEDFLRARIEGEDAEGYVVAYARGSDPGEAPLLYATTAGAPYERYEIERVSGPWWPYGDMEFTVRLFAEGGETVVEQPISLSNARLELDAKETTENGQPVVVPYEFFDGEVTVAAGDPWEVSWRFALALTLGDQGEERIELLADPFPVATGCGRGPAPSDASALAQSIQSDPDLAVTAPVGVSVGGVEGLAMDVTVAPGASVCESFESTQVLTQNDSHTGPTAPGVNLDQGSRMRLST